jgi:hypothetical protein
MTSTTTHAVGALSPRPANDALRIAFAVIWLVHALISGRHLPTQLHVVVEGRRAAQKASEAGLFAPRCACTRPITLTGNARARRRNLL